MIHYIEGNIFDSPAQVIVNAVNTVGVMGKGIALEYKKRYPRMFELYKNMCEKRLLKIGKLALIYEPDHWILLFPTKENWRYPSKLEYIEEGLSKFVKTYAEKNISSIAFPKLGCGNGELEWSKVKELMEKYLISLPIEIYIYLKNSDIQPEHKSVDSTIHWLRQNAKDLSFDGMKDDIENQTKLIPIEFELEGEKWQANYSNGLQFFCKTEEIKFSDEELYKIWDLIRRKNIVEAGTNEKVFYELLLKLGYLTKVKIIKGEQIIEGYQLNNGIGRAYLLREKLQ